MLQTLEELMLDFVDYSLIEKNPEHLPVGIFKEISWAIPEQISEAISGQFTGKQSQTRDISEGRISKRFRGIDSTAIQYLYKCISK